MKTATSMSRLLMLGLMTLSMAAWGTSAHAVLVAYDGFDYTSGAITGKGGTTDFGFTGNWTTGGVSGNVTTGLSRLPLTVTGSAADMTGGATTTNFRVLSAGLSPENATETWVSFLAQRTADTALGNFVGLSFYSGGTGDAQTEWAIATGSSGGQQMWKLVDLNNENPGVDTWTGVALENGRVDLLLAQVVWNAEGTEQVNLWVNPPTMQAALPAPTTRAMEIAFFDRVRFASQNGASFNFDELRIGDTFADVMKLIPPNPDLDGNGVGISDFTLIRNNFLTANTHAMGDVNFDGFVDHADFFVWREAFLSGGGSLSAISWSPVPEPGSVLLAGMAMVAGVAALRCRRRQCS